MLHILVVDDDPVIRMSLRTILTSEGYRVTTAADGEEAVLKLSEERLDIVLCDVYMPSMDGIKLRNIIRGMHQTEKLPILFISGHDDVQTLNIVRDHALEGFFKKGRPSLELISWVKYLTTPLHKRPTIPPHKSAKIASDHYLYGRNRGSVRSPVA